MEHSKLRTRARTTPQLGRRPFTHHWTPARSFPRTSALVDGRLEGAITAVPNLPESVFTSIQSANEDWKQLALGQPLEHPVTPWRVHIIGVQHYAPLNDVLVTDVLNQIQPQVVALEQPYVDSLDRPSTSPSPASPFISSDPTSPSYPEWIAACIEAEESLSPPSSNTSSAAPLNARPDQLDSLLQRLSSLSIPAAIGKDILDPYETFGFHPAAGYLTTPAQLAHIAHVFSFLPGSEYTSAARYVTQGAGLQVCDLTCIDAPLKLQEQWVKRLVQDFDITESTLSFQFVKELSRNEALVPDYYQRWDEEVAAAIQAQAPEQAATAFKASRAVAAAMLSPARVQEVTQRLSNLQPLKFRLFAKQERFMADRLAELCRAPAPKDDEPAVIVAVLGRQHVHGLMRLWQSKQFWAVESEKVKMWEGDRDEVEEERAARGST